MKNRWIPILILALLLFCLCGCGAAAVSADPTPSPTAEPTPEPTPTPTPVLTFPDGSTHQIDETRLTLHQLAHKDVAETAELLKQMPKLERIDLGTDGAWTRTESAQS